MKIVYITPTFPPYPGGIGINAFYNAREMARRGHAVEVFTPKYGKASGVPPSPPAGGFGRTGRDQKTQTPARHASQLAGVAGRSNLKPPKVHFLRPVLSFGNAAFLPQLLWRLRGFDIVHVYYPFFGGAEVAALARKFSKFKLVVHHEMDVVGEGWMKGFFSWHTRYMFSWILRQSDAVFSLSEDYFEHSDLGALYRANKCHLPLWQVVPNGVDTDLFRPVAEKKIPISNIQYPIILFAAGLDRAHYFKGVPVLFEAVKKLKDQSFAVRVRVAGEGGLKQEYQHLAEKLGIGESVEFVGLVTHDKLPEFYHSGNLFVMPSVGRTESFSIATAEAQACGLPAIVSDLPGMRVTIEDGVTGFTVKSGDSRDLAEKIRVILTDHERAVKMGRAGRARMEHIFSWRSIGDRLDKIYNDLIRT